MFLHEQEIEQPQTGDAEDEAVWRKPRLYRQEVRRYQSSARIGHSWRREAAARVRGGKVKREPKWDSYPVRWCRSSHMCAICTKEITYGQGYCDGGFGKRAHVNCVNKRVRAALEKVQG